MYLNYVMFVETLTSKATAAAENDRTSVETYHIDDVLPVRRKGPHKCSSPVLLACYLSGSVEGVQRVKRVFIIYIP